VAVDDDNENELALLEFIHNIVETLDKYFEDVVSKIFIKYCIVRVGRKLIR
jgi:hypothetical protein